MGEYNGKINDWRTYHRDRIQLEYENQSAGLNLLITFLDSQNQTGNFFGNLSGVSGLAAVVYPPYAYGLGILAAVSAVVSENCSPGVPSTVDLWNATLIKLGQMKIAALAAIDAETVRFKAALIAGLPSAIVLTSDKISYLLRDSATSTTSYGEVNVNLNGHVNYAARLSALTAKFDSIKPILQMSRPVHTAKAAYCAALMSYGMSRGWSFTLCPEYTYYPDNIDGFGLPQVIPTRWQADSGGWLFAFDAFDVASELTAKGFEINGESPYVNLP